MTKISTNSLDNSENDDTMSENFRNKETESVCEFVEKYSLYKNHTISDIKTIIDWYLIKPICERHDSELIKSFLKCSFNDVDWEFVNKKLIELIRKNEDESSLDSRKPDGQS